MTMGTFTLTVSGMNMMQNTNTRANRHTEVNMARLEILPPRAPPRRRPHIIMNQYTPCGTYPDHPELSRRLTTYEYEKVLRLARALGITNGYIQTGDTAKESFIPDFDETGV